MTFLHSMTENVCYRHSGYADFFQRVLQLGEFRLIRQNGDLCNLHSGTLTMFDRDRLLNGNSGRGGNFFGSGNGLIGRIAVRGNRF